MNDDMIFVANGVMTSVHTSDQCAGRAYGCWVHEVLSHALSDAPVVFRDDKGTAERICEHGIGHPDPQDAAYWWHEHGRDITPHGCDGCCRPFPEWAR
ncbi:hypothetical protein GCM10023146_01940 [Nocardioides caricicola]